MSAPVWAVAEARVHAFARVLVLVYMELDRLDLTVGTDHDMIVQMIGVHMGADNALMAGKSTFGICSCSTAFWPRGSCTR